MDKDKNNNNNERKQKTNEPDFFRIAERLLRASFAPPQPPQPTIVKLVVMPPLTFPRRRGVIRRFFRWLW